MPRQQPSDPVILLQAPGARPYRTGLVLGGAALIGLLTLVAVTAAYYRPLLYVAAAVGFYVLLRGAPYIWSHTEYLPFAAALLYLIIMLSPLSEALRATIHYGVLALIALPLIPRLLRSGLLREGGFRLYTYYFGWAAITCVYSLVPVFSIGRLMASALGFAIAAVCVLKAETEKDTHDLLFHFLLACAIFVSINFVSLGLPRSITWLSPLDGLDPRTVSLMTAQGSTLDQITRFRGLLGNPNAIGELMLASVTSALVCWRLATTIQKYFLTIVCTMAVIMAVAADSRSALGGLLLGCTLYVFWRYRVAGLVALGIVVMTAGAVAIKTGDLSVYTTRGLGTLTGRTDIWSYALDRIRERPIIGYGYQVSGEIFMNRLFPIWYGPWDMGPHSSLHDGYINYAVGVGIPATLFWLYLTARPWVFVFRQTLDPWNLKAVALIVVLPALIYNLTEASIVDFYGLLAFLFGLAWALAERQRLRAIAQERESADATFASLPAAAQALQGAAWSES